MVKLSLPQYNQALLTAIRRPDWLEFQRLWRDYSSYYDGKRCYDATFLLYQAVVWHYDADDPSGISQLKLEQQLSIAKHLLSQGGLAPFDCRQHSLSHYKDPDYIVKSACGHSHLSVIKLLLAAGAEINLADLVEILSVYEYDLAQSGPARALLSYCLNQAQIDLTWLFCYGSDSQQENYNYQYQDYQPNGFNDQAELFRLIMQIDSDFITRAILSHSCYGSLEHTLKSSWVVLRQIENYRAINNTVVLVKLGLIDATSLRAYLDSGHSRGFLSLELLNSLSHDLD